jgi:hypothetical protein
MVTTTTSTATWEPPASIAKPDLVRISEHVLGLLDRPISVREDVFRIRTLGLDWDIGGEVFEPVDPADVLRGPDGRKMGYFSLHGGAGDHRTRRTAATLLASKFGFKVVTMTYPGRLNFNDPNRDWPGDTINPDGTTRTPIYQIGEAIAPDEYELVQDRSDPDKYAKWGTLFFIRAKEGTRFYDRMAAWPIAFEEAMVEMCRRHLSEGYAVLAHGQSTGGPFAHIALQRVPNCVGLAGLETSQWGSIGATAWHTWNYPFNYLTIRTWRHVAKYLGPEAGEAGARRLPQLIEQVFEAWERVKSQPQFKAEYLISFDNQAGLEAAARYSASRLGLTHAETAALVQRYLNLTRPLSGADVKPVPPLLYQICRGSVDHKLERYEQTLFKNLDNLKPRPRYRAVLLDAGVHANEQPEEGLPRGPFPAAAQVWVDAISNGYYLTS